MSQENKNLTREVSFDISLVKADGENETKEVRVSVSSEEPYYRSWMWDEKNKKSISGFEVLGHADGEIDFSRIKDGLIIQDTHWGDQIGLVASPEVKDGKLGGKIEFCHGQRAQDIKADVLAGLRKNMSVGYFVSEYKLVGEKYGEPVYRAVKWTPYEGSFVNVPADTTVGVGRSHQPTAAEPAVVQKKGVSIMEKPEVKAGLTADQVVECFKLAKSAGMEIGEVNELIKSGKEFGEIRETLDAKVAAHIQELETKAAKPSPVAPAAAPKLSEEAVKEIKARYNIANVFRALAGEQVDIGFEREMSQEQAKLSGKAALGILVPDCIRSTAGQETHGRPAHGVIEGIGGDGNKLIATNLLSGSFIEGLRDELVLRARANVPVMTGLVGNIAIPKAGDKLTAAWISTEGGNATKTNTTFGQIEAKPHTMGAYVDITRQLLLQSSIDVQAFIVSELIYAMAYCLEDGAINGDGTSGAPKGLVQAITSAFQIDFGTAPSYDKLIDLIAKMKKVNSYTPAMRFFGDTDVWAKLAKTRDYTTISGQNVTGETTTDVSVAAAVGGMERLLNPETSRVLGREFIESHLAPAKKLIYGDFSQMMLCLWSGTDLVVDQYSNVLNGALRTVALQDADVLVRRPEAFCMATNVHA